MDEQIRGGEVLDEERLEDDEKLTTDVDQLLELLKTQEKIPMAEAAEELDVDLDVVQQWVDFLVEEQIVGVEYKFTKPYIYLNTPDQEEEEKEEEQIQNLEGIKEDFMDKAQDKNIPQKNLNSLWTNHVEKALEKKKDFFMKEASKRGLDNQQELWQEYKEKLLSA